MEHANNRPGLFWPGHLLKAYGLRNTFRVRVCWVDITDERLGDRAKYLGRWVIFGMRFGARLATRKSNFNS